MRHYILGLIVLGLAACGDSISGSGGSQSPPLLPFQTYTQSEQPRGGECSDDIDLAAPVISSAMGYDLENTRNSLSIITADNVADLSLNYSYSTEDVLEMRGAAAVTAQAIFFAAGNTLTAINRLSGCRYWSYTTGSAAGVFRSASVLLDPRVNGEWTLYAGDYLGQVHAVDASDGSLHWRSFAGSNTAQHFITGGMQLHDQKLIVPISSKEVVTGAFNPGGCCTTHGMVVALDPSSGEHIWEYHTTEEATEIIQPGERFGPNGAPVWSTPTIDRINNTVYFGTGQNYTEPTTRTSDAVIALDINSGKVKWVFQATANDAWNYGCQFNLALRCPDPEGHDFDFGAAPILLEDATTLLAADKGGMVYSVDTTDGSLNWSKKVSAGSKLGGIHWGMAVDSRYLYLAATDFEIDPASGSLEDLKPGANPGIYALDIRSGDINWEIHPQRDYQGLATPLLVSAALSVTNDVLFAGTLSGSIFAFSTLDGRELWSFDVSRDLVDINKVPGDGGSIDGAGFVIAGDGLLVNAGYTELFGGVGRYQAGTGNTLYVLSLDVAK
jgi:polyvinyl alcohol dehydrogenase (cytochrome)